MFIAKRSLPRKMYNIQVPAFNIIESGNIVLVAQPVDNVFSLYLTNWTIQWIQSLLQSWNDIYQPLCQHQTHSSGPQRQISQAICPVFPPPACDEPWSVRGRSSQQPVCPCLQ